MQCTVYCFVDADNSVRTAMTLEFPLDMKAAWQLNHQIITNRTSEQISVKSAYVISGKQCDAHIKNVVQLLIQSQRTFVEHKISIVPTLCSGG